MYEYHNTEIRAERLEGHRDHCDSDGAVYDITTLVRGDRLEDPEPHSDGFLVSPGHLSTTTHRRMIYAVSIDLRIHVAFDGNRGAEHAVKHETLFHNGDVAAAGEINVVDGVVASINDRSGSYGTTGQMKVDRRFANAVLMAFQRAQVPMTESAVDFLRMWAGI